ncbi:DUF3016 domain-containing protein [Massilia horti]|uniref:DUF3016 domain-containing protein n=1 Tax=Massilia horti TaxID=2562153 RepID=A0A4Y9SRY3_9BURK|nr:DUF3016 domain-containing protein [Massilia horti]TFW29235.1 DUF3016 domain-containing protein [Massilia horti]
MKTLVCQLTLAGLFLLAAGGASAGVTVTYNQPENFADLPFTTWEREDVMKGISEHFDKLGKALPPGQDIRIEVLDIDLAGREYPARSAGREIRVLRGHADWPRMHLRYWLEQDGRVIKSGEEQLSDMAYLDRTNRYFEGEQLRYEKQMINDWWGKTIGPVKR